MYPTDLSESIQTVLKGRLQLRKNLNLMVDGSSVEKGWPNAFEYYTGCDMLKRGWYSDTNFAQIMANRWFDLAKGELMKKEMAERFEVVDD